jgi:ABC-2 type transport system permease protein
MENFGNSILLTRFTLRRERFIALAWIVLLVLVVVGLVPFLREVYFADGGDEFAEMLEIPAMTFMIGPNFAAYTDDFGALYTTFMMLFTALAVGIMNVFLVARYTRADEELGRYEVLRSLPIGRLSGLNAALITAVIVNAALAVAVGLGMFAVGDSSMCFNGSMLWGVSLGSVGLVFAGITALFTQLSASSRGAIGYSFAILGIMYVLRAPGDMNPDLEWLSLISPLGLVLRTKAYVGNHWWPIAILLITAGVFSALAFKVNSIRDIDQGIIPSRAGRAHGSFLMKSPFGLAFKLSRNALLAWIVAMLLLAASYGSILGGIDEFIANSELYQNLLLAPIGLGLDEGLEIEEAVAMLHEIVREAGFSLPQLFSGMITNIMGIFVTVPVVLFVLKTKNEEREGRSEAILATPVCRNKLLASFAVIAFTSAIVIQIAQAIGMYAVAIASLDDPSELGLGFLIQANLMYVPAIWVMLGLVIFLLGLAPKFTGIIFALFGFSFFNMLFGRLGMFPAFTRWLSPFEFVPVLPIAPHESLNIIPLVVLVAIAAVLTIAGFVFYNKRDINAITH